MGNTWPLGSSPLHYPLGNKCNSIESSNPPYLVASGYPHYLSNPSSEPGTSLAVQWLRLSTSTAAGEGSIPSQGTKILYAVCHGQKKKKSSQPTEASFTIVSLQMKRRLRNLPKVSQTASKLG